MVNGDRQAARQLEAGIFTRTVFSGPENTAHGESILYWIKLCTMALQINTGNCPKGDLKDSGAVGGWRDRENISRIPKRLHFIRGYLLDPVTWPLLVTCLVLRTFISVPRQR